MKQYIFEVEKTKTGYSAGAKNFEEYPVASTGSTLAELKQNLLYACQGYNEYLRKEAVTGDMIVLEIDIPQLFEFYKEINASGLAKRTGMNTSVISQYANGHRKPSEKQARRILEGIRELGKELSELELAY